MERRFYIYKRARVYYAKLIDPKTGVMLNARSTGKTNKDEALVVIAGWLNSGLPCDREGGRRDVAAVFALEAILEAIRASPGLDEEDARAIIGALHERGLSEAYAIKPATESELLIDFLRRFWNWDHSPYIREKLALKHSMTKRRVYDCIIRVNAYWAPAFPSLRLDEVKRKDLKEFVLSLSERGLASGTINSILVAGTVALRWAFQNELIPADVTSGLLKLSGKPKKRGILDLKEAGALFELRWPDERVRLANLVASTTGLRIGEILALRRSDIGSDRLMIRHSWSNYDGLKCPKNGEERIVPLIPEIRDALLSLLDKNPHRRGADDFVFYSTTPKRPMDGGGVLDGLKEALVQLRAGEKPSDEQRKEAKEYWKERNIVFHSWRHFYATNMANRIDSRKVMATTGHKTGAVFEAYADHQAEEDFLEVAGMTSKVFDFATEAARIRDNAERRAM